MKSNFNNISFLRGVSGVFLYLLILSCHSPEKKNYITLQGNAQGTTFQIKYYDSLNRTFDKEIVQIFNDIDDELSIYKEGSLINDFNYSKEGKNIKGKYFKDVFSCSKDVWENTQYAFDPTVLPLVKYYGFYFKESSIIKIDSLKVDSLIKNIGFHKITYDSIYKKQDSFVMLDFNAIAQGYTVDVISEFLNDKGINNYWVEVGGELVVLGNSPSGNSWIIGIEAVDSDIEDRQYKARIALNKGAIATSGSYRKFYELDGKKYSHAINPNTGYPVTHNLLSVTVKADNCMLADAYATAFLVMGKEKTLQFLDTTRLNLNAYLILDNKGKEETYASNGFKKFLIP